MQTNKLRIKLGLIELDYEGDVSFSIENIETLLNTMQIIGMQVPSEHTPKHVKTNVQSEDSQENKGKPGTYSTNTIAAHLEAKTAPELVICAMTQIEILRGNSSSQRSAIAEEMKTATTYYNSNMLSNLSATLSNLVKGKRINEVAKDTYALNANERAKVEAKIANIG
jgi:hypothetical protein